ncbi:MAG: OmpA family protein, partial [Paracoccaceae bacterium]
RDEVDADTPDPDVIEEAPLDDAPEAQTPTDEAPMPEDAPAVDEPVTDEAPVADEPAADEAPAEDAPAADAAPAPETAEELFELLGDDIPEGVEAPEVIEAQPEAERFEAPPEPAAEPTAEETAVIEQMLAEPDTANAIDTLSRALGFGAAETEAETETPEAETDVAPEAEAVETEEPAQQPDVTPALPAAAAGLLRLLEGEQPEADAAPAADAADVIEQTITEETSRSSQEDFATTLSTDVPAQASRERSGLSNFERAGLVALGAVAVGMLINNNRVVATADDRVVVDRGQGNLSVWKDDNAILRQPGVVERTERFTDGSTLTTLERPDGTEIVTIRDATGRVLRRDRIELDGSRTQLFDDTRPFERVSVSTLPEPRLAEVRISERTDPALLRALLAEAETQNLGRTYSLTQVREIRELRELAPEILSEPVTFSTASAVVRPSEAAKLVQLGRLMQQLVADNPREVFLIEGHTDAVGSAAYNLALSDRRAESVALALSEYFGVPPENMVVQGYGKRFLKVPTLEAEPQNRRVAVRRVSWLIH